MVSVGLDDAEDARLPSLALTAVWDGIMEVAPEDGARLRELIN